MKKTLLAFLITSATLMATSYSGGYQGGDGSDAKKMGIDQLGLKNAVVPNTNALATHGYTARNIMTDTGPAATDAAKRGFNIVFNTINTIGPNGDIKNLDGSTPAPREATCAACHIAGGQNPYTSNYWKVMEKFNWDNGIYNSFSDTYRTALSSTNGCLVACLGAEKMQPEDQPYMLDIKAYFNWVRLGFPEGTYWKDMPGNSFDYSTFNNGDIYTMKADISRGADIYTDDCRKCHGDDGQGELESGTGHAKYPPLWGARSYTKGAAYYSVPQLASVIKRIMPFNHAGDLSAQQALDVAGYINTRSRSLHKSGKYYKGYHDVTGAPLVFHKKSHWNVGVNHPDEPFTEYDRLLGPWKDIKDWRANKLSECLENLAQCQIDYEALTGMIPTDAEKAIAGR